MIAVDTNLLVYSHREELPAFEGAGRKIRELADSPRLWAIPWPCIHEFLAIVTNPRIFRPATPVETALTDVSRLLEAPALQLIGENEGYWDELRRLLRSSGVVGSRVHDARIAAICIANGVAELWSADRDFGRFPTLAVRNPLVEGFE
jgi:uncharacterized protein